MALVFLQTNYIIHAAGETKSLEVESLILKSKEKLQTNLVGAVLFAINTFQCNLYLGTRFLSRLISNNLQLIKQHNSNFTTLKVIAQ